MKNKKTKNKKRNKELKIMNYKLKIKNQKY